MKTAQPSRNEIVERSPGTQPGASNGAQPPSAADANRYLFPHRFSKSLCAASLGRGNSLRTIQYCSMKVNDIVSALVRIRLSRVAQSSHVWLSRQDGYSAFRRDHRVAHGAAVGGRV